MDIRTASSTCARSTAGTGACSRRSGGVCSRASGTRNSRARSSASAASGCARGSCFCSDETTRTRSSCSSRKRGRRCWRRTPAAPRSRTTPSAWSSGQRIGQAASDIFLGWTRVEDEHGTARDFYVRQLRDWKMSIDVERIGARGLATYAWWCAWCLARAHARSSDRIAIASYLGKSAAFDRAIAEFSAAYADLNDRDHAALAQAVEDGRVTALEGV